MAEAQLKELAASSAARLEAAEAAGAEAMIAMEAKLRHAEERNRSLEALVPQLEAAAKQADARAATEASARELLAKRAEASEARLGRLEAANHIMRQQRQQRKAMAGGVAAAPPPDHAPPAAPLDHQSNFDHRAAPRTPTAACTAGVIAPETPAWLQQQEDKLEGVGVGDLRFM